MLRDLVMSGLSTLWAVSIIVVGRLIYGWRAKGYVGHEGERYLWESKEAAFGWPRSPPSTFQDSPPFSMSQPLPSITFFYSLHPVHTPPYTVFLR